MRSGWARWASVSTSAWPIRKATIDAVTVTGALGDSVGGAHILRVHIHEPEHQQVRETGPHGRHG